MLPPLEEPLLGEAAALDPLLVAAAVVVEAAALDPLVVKAAAPEPLLAEGQGPVAEGRLRPALRTA